MNTLNFLDHVSSYGIRTTEMPPDLLQSNVLVQRICKGPVGVNVRTYMALHFLESYIPSVLNTSQKGAKLASLGQEFKSQTIRQAAFQEK